MAQIPAAFPAQYRVDIASQPADHRLTTAPNTDIGLSTIRDPVWEPLKKNHLVSHGLYWCPGFLETPMFFHVAD